MGILPMKCPKWTCFENFLTGAVFELDLHMRHHLIWKGCKFMTYLFEIGIKHYKKPLTKKFEIWDISPQPTPRSSIANFDLKIVPKNCANFMINCAAFFKFCAVQHFAECWGGFRRRQPPPLPIANFDFIIVSKNCANFVLKCAVIFKFCAAPLPEISPRTFWEPASPGQFSLRNGVKKWY